MGKRRKVHFRNSFNDEPIRLNNSINPQFQESRDLSHIESQKQNMGEQLIPENVVIDNKESNKFNADFDDMEEVIIPQHVLNQEEQVPENPENIQELTDNINESPQSNDSFVNESFDFSDLVAIEPFTSSIDVEKKENNIETHEEITKNRSDNFEDNENKNDIDKILLDVLPNYRKEISIELHNVSLTFEVENDKIDNFKEYFIRTLKHDKGNKTQFQVLKNISFKVYKGEKVGIIGYNGAGKSTLLSLISGIYEPNEGEVKTNGKISPLLSLGAGFDRNYSGRENIFLNGAVLGYDKEFLKRKYDEIVEFSELDEFIDFPIKNYSSGMLAKLGFSIATIVEPDILIIDEILGVGDINFRKKSSTKIRSLMDSGTTVILVSHSIPQIRELCDKAIWIDKGQVREIGEVNKVCNNYLKDSEKATKEQLKDIRFI